MVKTYILLNVIERLMFHTPMGITGFDRIVYTRVLFLSFSFPVPRRKKSVIGKQMPKYWFRLGTFQVDIYF